MSHQRLHVAGVLVCGVAMTIALAFVDWGWIELLLIYPGSGICWMALLALWSLRDTE